MPGDPADAPTVLVVEDSRLNRLVLARGVEREGHVVLQAEDGAAALECLATQHVDMVLLDLLMPEVDGFEVLERMGSDAELREIPVLVISAIEASEDVARALEMGAIDCLPKPVDPLLLKVRMRTALEQARLRRLEKDYLQQELALRQQERLATLGRLSAGLGHELNNPAAAALSTSRQLQTAIEASDGLLAEILATPGGAEVVAIAGRLESAAIAPQSPSDREDLEDGLADALSSAGVSDPWTHAAELAAVGVQPAEVAEAMVSLGHTAPLALRWLRMRIQIRRGVTQIASSVERMAELTAALRGYSYLDRAPQQDVDVRRGLDDTLTILDHKLPEGVEVVRDYAPQLPTIHAYGGQLNQVWTNLIDNAIDAVGTEGTITVRLRPGDHGRGIVVEVEDDGPGIPIDLQGQVFDPFLTTKPPGQGTGLGLSISRQIIAEAHAGSLRVASRPGATVFRATLPASPPQKDLDDDDE